MKLFKMILILIIIIAASLTFFYYTIPEYEDKQEVETGQIEKDRKNLESAPEELLEVI